MIHKLALGTAINSQYSLLYYYIIPGIIIEEVFNSFGGPLSKRLFIINI